MIYIQSHYDAPPPNHQAKVYKLRPEFIYHGIIILQVQWLIDKVCVKQQCVMILQVQWLIDKACVRQGVCK